MRKRVPLTAAMKRGYYVDLPTYVIVEGSFLPVTSGKISAEGVLAKAQVTDVLALKPSVLVDLPDEWEVKDGQLVAGALRKRYKEHAWFGSNDYTPPAFLD